MILFNKGQEKEKSVKSVRPAKKPLQVVGARVELEVLKGKKRSLFKLNKKAPGSSILDKHSDSDISNITSNRDAISLPNDTIYTTDPTDTALTAHEIEHQSQYQNGDKKEVFETLVGEALDKASGKSDPYKDNKTLEYAAQQVQDRVNKALSSGGN